MITYNSLNKYKEIAHFCTDREGGASMGNYASLNISPFSGDNPENVRKNKEIICQQFDIDTDRLIIPYQTHGTKIVEIEDSFFQLSMEAKAQALYGVDALFTRLTRVCIAVTTADCVPILFFDPQKQVIAVAHAGWRGTCSRIAEKTATGLIDRFDCNPADIRVVIGPSISPGVYEVGEEVVDKFRDAGFDISRIVSVRNHSLFLDLWEANKQTLQRIGISDDHIELSGICTYTEHERFFSARRLGIKSGRLATGIMLRDK
jgi:polyphenol oxidase